VSFRFKKDYLQDLEPILAKLDSEGLGDVVAQIAECKAAGSTGGEILTCINHALRQTLRSGVSRSLNEVIESYLRKAPGY
jgi:hypothetical protein